MSLNKIVHSIFFTVTFNELFIYINFSNYDIINGNESLVVYTSAYLNGNTQYGILFTNLQMSTKVSLFNYERATAGEITDTSIKEIYLEKQVRRVEQQDSWKFDADYEEQGKKERGHAEYYKFGTRDVIHLSAH